MKISFITTIFNEEKTVHSLLESLNNQTLKPDEIIIVDGASRDDSFSVVSNFKFKINKENIKVISLKGNRSKGRNAAIEKSSGDIILSTDAGCTLDKNWIKNIVKPFDDNADVVAGFYKGKAEGVFEKSLIPYVLVMNDKVNENDFLPATRSMAFRKSIWEKAGRFDERLSNNEDYAFAKKLKKINSKIVYVKDAIVYWKPRKNIYEAFIMFYRFALGDIEAGIVRPKVILIFVRYLAGIILFSLYLFTGNIAWIFLILFLLASYVIWAIMKNYGYVKDIKALVYLPLLQFTSDIAVLSGTSLGFLRKSHFFRL